SLVLALELNHAIGIAFIALAVAPVPPSLAKKEAKAGGAQSYIIGLLALTSVASIVLVPATVELLARLFERAVHVSPRSVAGIVALSVLAPLAAGVVFRRLAPSVADRIAKPLSIAGTALLIVAALPV